MKVVSNSCTTLSSDITGMPPSSIIYVLYFSGFISISFTLLHCFGNILLIHHRTYNKLTISLFYLTREHYVEFVKAVDKPVLFLEGSKGVNSMFPNLKGMFCFKVVCLLSCLIEAVSKMPDTSPPVDLPLSVDLPPPVDLGPPMD